MMDLRLPNITATDESGQLRQLKSYLFQMVGELNYALKTMDRAGTTAGSAVKGLGGGGGTEKTAPMSTFQDIKALIIKSADIVEAYYDEISRRLEGIYVAQSEFGTYKEETELAITESATEIRNEFSSLQSIQSDVEGIQNTLLDISACIRTGRLEVRENEDGTQFEIYGVEVGQRVSVDGEEIFNKYARFTADRLSFYDTNGNEVAYVSDQKLYISNVEITGSYRIGRLEDTVQSDGSVVTMYLGG